MPHPIHDTNTNLRYLEYSEEQLNNVSTSQLIATTFQLYGSIFGISFILFLCLRYKFPKVYTFNSTPHGEQTELARNRHGVFNWMWNIFKATDDEIFHNCGFSAIVYLRFLRLGFKLSAWGILNSIYLIPINVYGCDAEDDPCSDLKDAINRASVGNVSANNPSLLATTFAAYVIFGKAMHLIFKEFRWFTKYRHKFSTKARPDNYTVYVSHIPEEYRSDIALLEYFRSIFSHEDVLEAKIALDLFNLDKKVSRREAVLKRLEHAINIRNIKGYEPTYMAETGAELHELNEEISNVVTQVESAKNQEKDKFMRAMLMANGIKCNSNSSQQSFDRTDKLRRHASSRHLLNTDDLFQGEDDEKIVVEDIRLSKTNLTNSDIDLTLSDSGHEGLDEVPSIGVAYGTEHLQTVNSEEEPFIQDGIPIDPSLISTPKPRAKHKRQITFSSLGSATTKSLTKAMEKGMKVKKMVGKSVEHVGKYSIQIGQTVAGRVNDSAILVKKVAGKRVKKSIVNVTDLAVFSAQLATKASSRLTRLLLNTDDGKVRESGFVTFTKLSTKAQCAQIIHHESPYKFLVKDAPLPKDIIWDNVGLSHEEIHTGIIAANAATVGLMVVWTIPVAFFTSLSEAESLKEVLPALEKVIEKHPWVATFLAQLSPLLLVLLTELVPVVLSIVCRYEGHIGKNTWDASLLTKISIFLIVQIFFVQAISGSIFEELRKMLQDSSLIIDLLATSIPTQVKSFIQFILVQMFLGCSIELLRVPRVAMAIARGRIGPNLTEKERNEPYFFLKPITAPESLEYPMRYSEMILYFMVNLVYSCVAPIMSYFVMFTFGILNVVYRHQVIYTYCPKNDKGGKLWPNVIMLLVACMFIAEVTLIGILSIKKGAAAAVLLGPLFGATVGFFLYIRQEHLRVTEFVPSTLCKAKDIKNHATLDVSFLNNQYLQPSLKSKILYPENYVGNIEYEQPIGNVLYSSPLAMPNIEEGLGDTKFRASLEQEMESEHESVIIEVDSKDDDADERSYEMRQTRNLGKAFKKNAGEPDRKDEIDVTSDKDKVSAINNDVKDQFNFTLSGQTAGTLNHEIIIDHKRTIDLGETKKNLNTMAYDESDEDSKHERFIIHRGSFDDSTCSC